jgi:hypothetical protein
MKTKLMGLLGFLTMISVLDARADGPKSPTIVFTGVPQSFNANQPSYVLRISLSNKDSGEDLKCGVDLDIVQFIAKDESGKTVFSTEPTCRTNLGGVLTATFLFPSAGQFLIYAVPSDPNIDVLPQAITVYSNALQFFKSESPIGQTMSEHKGLDCPDYTNPGDCNGDPQCYWVPSGFAVGCGYKN